MVSLQEIADDTAVLTNALSGIVALPTVIDLVFDMTNAIRELQDITNALAGLDWSDVLYIKQGTESITNQLRPFDWSTVMKIEADTTDITNALSQLSSLQDFFDLFVSYTNQLDELKAEVRENKALLQIITNQLANP
jgi:hypothetical protein